jgi:serine/threonine-protein kinase
MTNATGVPIDPLLGQTIGRYTVIERLGKGGMAIVYRARDTQLDRDVALKLIKVEASTSPEFTRRFEREAKMVASLAHPNILKVFDFGQFNGQSFLVIELMLGGSLDEKIREQQLAVDLVARILDQIAGALDYAHGRGIIHRDMKPQNILLDKMGNAFLTDFGIAKIMEGDVGATGLTAAGAVVGTPLYMSPEQWSGQILDGRADIYALGIILYEMLTQYVPYNGETPFRLMQQHIYEAPEPLVLRRRDLPNAVQSVLDKSLAKQRDIRFSTAGELANAFREALQGRAVAVANAPIRPMSGEVEEATFVGAAVSSPSPTPKSPASAPAAYTDLSVPMPAAPPDTSPTRGSGRILLIAGLAAIFVAVIAGLTVILSGVGGGSPTATQTFEPTSVAIVPTAIPTPLVPTLIPTDSPPTQPPPTVTPLPPTLTPIPPTVTLTPLPNTNTPTSIPPTLTATITLTPSATLNLTATDSARATRLAQTLDSAVNATLAALPTSTPLPPTRTFTPIPPTLTPTVTLTLTPTRTPTPLPPTLTPTPVRIGLVDINQPEARIVFFGAKEGDRTQLGIFVYPGSNGGLQLIFSLPSIAKVNGLTIAPDGKSVVFAGDQKDGISQLYRVNLDGSGLTALTTDPNSSTHPDFSGDGQRIVFTRTVNGNSDIYVMDSDGSNVTQLTTEVSADSEPTWLSNGTEIYFSSDRAGRPLIWRMNSDGSGQKIFTNNTRDTSPDVSPDGTRLTFTSEFGGGKQLWWARTSDAIPIQLTTSSGENTNPRWSLDGQLIAFVTTRNGTAELFVMNRAGSAQRAMLPESVSKSFLGGSLQWAVLP